MSNVQPKWEVGLYDCFSDCNTCCLVCWCRCVAYADNLAMLEERERRCIDSCSFYCASLLIGGIMALRMGMDLRSRIRAKYNLPDEPCSDCCVHYFCQSCAICQEHRILKARTAQYKNLIDGSNDDKQGNNNPSHRD